MPTPMNTLTAVEYLCMQIALALDDDWTFQPGDRPVFTPTSSERATA
jgi:hypothetical protein